MDIFELFTEAVSSLTLNKMRTALAALGIIIGTGSVIALISLGQASQKQVQTQIQSLGSNLLTVMPGAQSNGAIRGAQGSSETLTYEDAKAMMENTQLTYVKKVSAELQRRVQAVAGKNNTNTQVIGTLPSYAEIKNLNMFSGTFIAQRDVDSMTRVAVLGPTVVSNLFGEGIDPTGQSLRINGQIFKIIGVTAAKGGAGFQNPDDSIYIPLTTAQKQIFGVDYISTISVEAISSDVMVKAQDQVGYFLLSRHKIKNVTDADFSILSQSDILGAATQITGTLTGLLSGIAAISLIVGGIGIMNIMLVTVTERTREIGLRKTLGAKKKIIITQFLIEAILLTLIGGIIGTLVGALVSYIISKIISLPFTLAIHSIALALGVSGIIGIVFGWYPARKAALLQPIEALRYE